ncbi:MAG: DUF5666 domain-containing protein [Actinomycetota bacterium]|nr:DUF5666 domain-containing protein [Actinomycetota bacterium]
MEPNDTSSTPPAPTRSRRSLTRTTGLVALAGLTTGGAFAAVSGISAASNSAPSAPATTAAPFPATPDTDHGWGAHGPFGGSAGTITAVNGTTLTLRTEQGTETVKTTASTTYTKERLTISFAQLRLGAVVRVEAPRPMGKTATPGTGNVTATQLDVVLPEFSGRVSQINGGTYTVVGSGGQLRTVTATTGTRYFNGPTKTTAASVKVGTYIVAEGNQDSLTHLSADVITVASKEDPGFGPHGGPFRGRNR